MAYSIDLRKRVLDFIHNGGKKAEAARRFSVDRTTIYRWLLAEDPLAPPENRDRKNEVSQRGCTKKTCRRLPRLDLQ